MPLLAWPLRAWRSASMLTVLLPLVAACAVWQPQLQEPEYRLTRIEPVSLGLLEQRFLLTIAVDNPNAVSIPVRSLRYRLAVGGAEFATGHSDMPFTIPARGSAEFTVESSTQLMDSLPRILALLHTGERRLGYRLEGEVEYGRFFRGRKPFEQQGVVRLDGPR